MMLRRVKTHRPIIVEMCTLTGPVKSHQIKNGKLNYNKKKKNYTMSRQKQKNVDSNKMYRREGVSGEDITA